MSTRPHTMERVEFDPHTIYRGDCLDILPQFPDECVDLIYIDPPFNSNRNYEVFWGNTAEKRAFEDRYGETKESSKIQCYPLFVIHYSDFGIAAIGFFSLRNLEGCRKRNAGCNADFETKEIRRNSTTIVVYEGCFFRWFQ